MNKEVITDLAWGLGILAVALAASTARKSGYIDGETVTRVVEMLAGHDLNHMRQIRERLPKSR